MTLSSGKVAFAQEPAARAQAFVESVGVCTHFGYGDTPYGMTYAGVKARLQESGIRHVRDGILRPVETERIKDLGRLGIRFCIVAEPELGTPPQIVDKVKAINRQVKGAIDTIEGPNEPDLFWVSNKKAYEGKSGANGSAEAVAAAALFQKDVYRAFKADVDTRDLTIIGPALGKTYEPGKNPLPPGSLTSFVDWGNFHPYFGGNPFSNPFPYDTIERYLWNGTNPSTNIDEFPYAFVTYAPPFAPKPMAATEAGCATDTNGTSELAHGKYLPRMFLEYFRKGIQRTYSYEFVDEFPDPNNREARFGLLRRDLTPKPAFTALKNLLALLSDPPPRTALPPRLPPTAPILPSPTQAIPHALDFTLEVSPVGEYTRTQYVHHLLLQKRSGDFYLCIWHEIANEDKSVTPRRQITPPPLPALLAVRTPLKAKGALYQWDEEGKMTETPVTLAKGVISLSVPDRVMVLRLSPLPQKRD